MSSPAVQLDARERWLAARRELLTASDCAAVLGVDPRRGPLAVYASKVGQIEQEQTAWMKWGRRVEGAIADWYAEETGRPVVDLGAHEIQRHPDVTWLGCTLDRVTAGSAAHPDPAGNYSSHVNGLGPRTGPLDAKAVAGFKAAEWREDPPLHYVVQVQVQMACTGAQWGGLVALIGGIALAWRDVQRDDAFLAAALPKLEEFWLRVQRRDPPEADALPGTSEAIRRLWAHADGETIPLDDEALSIVTQWDAAKVVRDSAEETKEEAENRLRARLGFASYGRLPDGSVLTLKETNRGGYTVQPTSFRVLRRWWPKLQLRLK